MRVHSWLAAGLAGATFLMAAPCADAQDSLVAARDLYASAAYDDALRMLNGLVTRDPAGEDRESLELYRILCLVALGRKTEADRAIEAMVARAPLYRPSAEDVSPRVRSSFTDIRRRVLPPIIQRKYLESKAAFDRQEFANAADGFKQMLDALTDPDLETAAAQPPLSDLRILAIGFHELSAKAAAPPPLPTAALALPPPQGATARRLYSAQDGNVVAPMVIRQDMPSFPGKITVPGTGIIEVIIDETGAVESAAMRASLGPQYDKFALSAAKSWRYRPAMLQGVPVRFKKAVQVNLAPVQ